MNMSGWSSEAGNPNIQDLKGGGVQGGAWVGVEVRGAGGIEI